MPEYSYTAVVNYYDKNRAQRLNRKTVKAKNLKAATKKLQTLGKIISIKWESTPGLLEDMQMELFVDLHN